MQEPSLPTFAPGNDPGPSFFELLRREMPHALPGAGVTGAAVTAPAFDITHGTTVLALRYADGVIIAGDRRATEGYTIANRRMDKVYAADRFSGVAIAGAAGPAMEMVRLFQTELEHYEKTEGVPLSLDGKANKLSQMIRSNLPAAIQGFVVVPIFAGWDVRLQRGRLFKFDVTGGRYEEADFNSTGSGSVHARNWLKAGWREGMTESDAVDLALRALFQAADEDSATGGPDLVRRIFPSVATIGAGGFVMLPDGDLEARANALLGGQP
jgi:proteasome beta subunit